jgi:hypothetical protein
LNEREILSNGTLQVETGSSKPEFEVL